MSRQHTLPVDYISIQHADSEHLVINNTFLRRCLTLLALKTTARFFRRHGPCIPISRHLIVKTGKFVHLTEATTLKFIGANTSVPVPRVYCSFVHHSQAYIVMERIQGETFAESWTVLSEADRESIFRQLRKMLSEVRRLCPSGPGVQSCTGGSLRDSRIPRSRPRFGPFTTIHEFHRWLREGLQADDQDQYRDRIPSQDWKEIQDMVARQDGPWPPPVFTHGDLNPFNILVRGARVVGIVDWEFSGWYPYYWEYTSSWHGNKTRQAWQELISRFLDPDLECLRMETTRQKWWGDF